MLQHPTAAKWQRRGLFQGVSSFNEVEKQIAALGSAKDQGDAFEIFVEAFLRTVKHVQCRALWMPTHVPSRIALRLGLKQGIGIDGLYETHSGDLIPYQVKYRACSKLVLGDLGSFWEITKSHGTRLVVTNAASVSRETMSRALVIQRASFLELNADEWVEILALINRSSVKAKSALTPNTHQQEAVKAICTTLKNRPRATVVMPCGTGKTFVSLLATQRLGARSVLVLVPTLLLLRQTLRDWFRSERFEHGLSAFALCSPLGSSDDFRSESDDMAWEAGLRPFDAADGSTDQTRLKDFLTQRTKRTKVVISTYASAPLLSSLKGYKPVFDVGVFDEAHKTAGVSEGAYGFALSDDNLVIRKRMFLTATPRVIRKRDGSHRDENDYYSMDDETRYGPVAYRMTYGEAIKRQLVVPYKIVISLLKASPVLLRKVRRGHANTRVRGRAMEAAEAAKCPTVFDTFKKTGSRRILSFHATIRRASAFAEAFRAHARDCDGKYRVLHVNGKQPITKRLETLEAFKEHSPCLLTNARALTEGVDVPAIDTVFFSDPKGSKIDISQAIGRAMRPSRADNKTHCYITLPLLARSLAARDVEEAIQGTGFEPIATVLQALLENDERLLEVVQQQSERLGRGLPVDGDAIAGFVELPGCSIPYTKLLKMFATRVVSRLGVTWDEMFSAFQAYAEKSGSGHVPEGVLAPNGLDLSGWCRNQRTRGKIGQLSAKRVSLLDRAGFIWDVREHEYRRNLALLALFREKNGHCDVPQKFQCDGVSLGQWVSRLRLQYKKNELDPTVVEELNALEFIWHALEQRARHALTCLAEYKREHGHINVPHLATYRGLRLGSFLAGIRVRLRGGKAVPRSTLQALERLGFVVNRFDSQWDSMTRRLEAFKKKHGHCDVIRDGDGKNPCLYTWVVAQRRKIARDEMPPKRKKQLRQIGLRLDTNRDATFNESVAMLKQFYDREGTWYVPQNHIEGRIELARFIERLRSGGRRLNTSRRKSLRSIGFPMATLRKRT